MGKYAKSYVDIKTDVADAMKSLMPDDSYYLRTHARRLARTLEITLDQQPQGKLLELGTSTLLPLALKRLAPDLEVHVTDFDMDKEPKGKMLLSLGNDSMEASVYRLDLETQLIPVDGETFDVVLCCEVIEHMEVDPMHLMSEINRVLKPDGLLVLTTPNATSSRAIHKILRGIEPYFYMQYRHKPSLYRHNYEYSVYSLTNVLQSAGFDGKVWTEDSFEDPILDDVEKLRDLGYSLSHIGDNIFVVARKIGPVVDRHPAVIYAD
jgi:SAM-dependent methyltransferase